MSEGEYTVRLIDMEVTVPGACVLDADGFANIYINARLNRERQREALRHELRHLRREDHYNDMPLGEVER